VQRTHRASVCPVDGSVNVWAPPDVSDNEVRDEIETISDWLVHQGGEIAHINRKLDALRSANMRRLIVRDGLATRMRNPGTVLIGTRGRWTGWSSFRVDERAFRSSRHEACHASAASTFGWRVTRVSRDSFGNGKTEFRARSGPDSHELVQELGVIIAMPWVVDTEGCSEDLEKLDRVLRAGHRLSVILETAAELQSDAVFLRRQRAIEGRLLVEPTLDENAIADLLA
jgi:hypothetical protein